MAVQEAVVVIAAVLAVSAVGVFVAPRAMRAATTDGAMAPSAPADPRLAPVFDAVRALFEDAEGVLGVWERPDGRGPAVLLWHHDGAPTGEVNAGEVVLLTHSPTLRVLAAYMVGEEGDPGAALATGGVGARFPDAFRGLEGVERRVIATGLARVRVERSPAPGGEETWTIGLTWDPGASDESVPEASFAVRRRALGAGRW